MWSQVGLLGERVAGGLWKKIKGWGKRENRERTDRDIIIFMFLYITLL